MKLNRITRVIGIGVGSSLIFAGAVTGSASAVPMSPTPKEGQCYNITGRELSSAFPVTSSVSCSKRHNAEVWKVGVWPSNANPYELSPYQSRTIAKKQCKGFGFPTYEFNYWAYYVPTQSEWNRGERWLRCDAMEVKFDDRGNIKIVYWWRGPAL
jgi:hypothetical protein